MKISNLFRATVLVIVLTSVRMISVHAGVVVSSSTGPQFTFSASTSDLAEQGQGTLSSLIQNSGSAMFGTAVGGLNDGTVYGSDPVGTDTSTHEFAPSDGSVVTLSFNTLTNIAGYDITSIVSLTSDISRAGQVYDLAYSLVGSPGTFTPLTGDSGDTVNRPDGTTQEQQVTISGGIPSGVAALQFTFHNSDSLESVFGEIDVFGHPVPEPSSCVLFGLAACGLWFAVRRRHNMSKQVGSAAHIAAILAVVALCAAPASATLVQGTITSTSQVINPSNVPAGKALLAAVDLMYSTQSGVPAPGVVNGVTFQNIDFLGGSQALTGGGSLTPVASLGTPDSGVFARNQGVSTSGPNASVFNGILDTMGYDGDSAGNFRTLEFQGLTPGQSVAIQLFGGDDDWHGGTGTISLINTVDLSSQSVGIWNISDNDNTTAAFADFSGVVDPNGNLYIQVVTGGSPQVFVALAGAVVVSTPEPGSLLLLGLGVLGMLVAVNRRRRA